MSRDEPFAIRLSRRLCLFSPRSLRFKLLGLPKDNQKFSIAEVAEMDAEVVEPPGFEKLDAAFHPDMLDSES